MGEMRPTGWVSVRPLPHQIRAVYGELLRRTPLGFLRADDPGAGKTSMAGLYVKELVLREDVIRIEVKARIDGASDYSSPTNEVMLGKKAAPRYRLALVRVDPRGPRHDQVRYLAGPFATTELGGSGSTGRAGSIR